MDLYFSEFLSANTYLLYILERMCLIIRISLFEKSLFEILLIILVSQNYNVTLN